MRVVSLGVVLALSLVAGVASAATITRTYSFTFSDFTPGVPGNPAPVDPVTGSFSVTFDPTVAVSDTTDGLDVHGVNLPISGHFAYSFTPFGALTFGGIAWAGDQASAASFGTDDFSMAFFHPLTTPIAPSAFYTRAGVPNAWFAGTGVVTAIDGVPEPSTWGLTIVGVGVAGAALRRRRRVSAA